MTPKRMSKRILEAAYRKYNHRRHVHPDPLEFVYRYESPAEQEIAALVAALLAYGRVAQILRSVHEALARLDAPLNRVAEMSLSTLKRRYRGYRHRFTAGEEVARLLHGAGRVIRDHGSLGNCFAGKIAPSDETVLPALDDFVDTLSAAAGGPLPFLLPSPRNKSACKRLNLLVRWMSREDSVDPGGWRDVPAAKLIVPLDTHMHRVGLAYGLTTRKSGDMTTALEITRGFRRFCPEDPVRYDFALTRMGIWSNWRGEEQE